MVLKRLRNESPSTQPLPSKPEPGRRNLAVDDGPFASTSVYGLNGQLICDVVPFITRVTLDPEKRDFPVLDGRDKRLPEVLVGDRLLLRVLPTPSFPANPPLVPEAIDDVGAVAPDLQRTIEMSYRVEDRLNLHTLVRRWIFRPRGPRAAWNHPRPAARAGVSRTCTVGVDHRRNSGVFRRCSVGRRGATRLGHATIDGPKIVRIEQAHDSSMTKRDTFHYQKER